jgi:hypothetical protein
MPRTLPSVTVRRVSITESFVSRLGVSSRKLITTCTILVTACLSCPCFFESNRTCSFNKLQSPASFAIVIMATRIRDVDARSEAFMNLVCRLKVGLEMLTHLAGLFL